MILQDLADHVLQNPGYLNPFLQIQDKFTR
jgi:hypothetical protein